MATQQPSTFPKVTSTLLAGADPEKPLSEQKAECVQRFSDLGLGRGVDAAKNKPWLQKSSFQVRNVTFDSIVGTEEGGAVEAYESTVMSVQTLQLSLKASISAPSNAGPVKVGMDSEHSRTTSTTRRVVGRRVQNRTIAFKESFDDVSYAVLHKPHAPHHLPEAPHTPPIDTTEDDTSAQHFAPIRIPARRLYTFDERLCEWVLENMHSDHSNVCSEQYIRLMKSGVSPSHVFEDWFRSESATRRDSQLIKALRHYCDGFVSNFHITHYVSAIQLGAVEYRVMSEQEYYRSVSQSGSLGYSDIATGAAKGGYSRKRSSKSTHVRCIGAIQGDTENGHFSVARGTYGEAVIEAEFKPVTTLIRNRHLRSTLQRAVTRYIEGKADASGE